MNRWVRGESESAEERVAERKSMWTEREREQEREER